MVGVQVGAVSFVDEGTDQVLDAPREMAAVDSLFVAAFTYGRGIVGRMPRGNPLPGRRRPEGPRLVGSGWVWREGGAVPPMRRPLKLVSR